MTLVDTCVWVDYFNGRPTPAERFVKRTLREDHESLVVLPVIITEVAQGFRSESGFRVATAVLRKVALPDPPVETYIDAAALYRSLRRSGVTVRGVVDCLIAQTCIEWEIRLLTDDRDFRQIARHTALELAQPDV